jgi:hypothetical protein
MIKNDWYYKTIEKEAQGGWFDRFLGWTGNKDAKQRVFDAEHKKSVKKSLDYISKYFQQVEQNLINIKTAFYNINTTYSKIKEMATIKNITLNAGIVSRCDNIITEIKNEAPYLADTKTANIVRNIRLVAAQNNLDEQLYIVFDNLLAKVDEPLKKLKKDLLNQKEIIENQLQLPSLVNFKNKYDFFIQALALDISKTTTSPPDSTPDSTPTPPPATESLSPEIVVKKINDIMAFVEKNIIEYTNINSEIKKVIESMQSIGIDLKTNEIYIAYQRIDEQIRTGFVFENTKKEAIGNKKIMILAASMLEDRLEVLINTLYNRVLEPLRKYQQSFGAESAKMSQVLRDMGTSNPDVINIFNRLCAFFNLRSNVAATTTAPATTAPATPAGPTKEDYESESAARVTSKTNKQIKYSKKLNKAPRSWNS